jgi:hypothetical protein
MVPASLGSRVIGINADMARSITDLAEKLRPFPPSSNGFRFQQIKQYKAA